MIIFIRATHQHCGIQIMFCLANMRGQILHIKPDTPIILVSPIFCPSAEETPGPTLPNDQGKFVTVPGHSELREGCLTLVRTRKLISRIVAARSEAGDRHLSYLDGLELFGADDADDLPDDLHPTADGYLRMGRRFAPVLADVLRRRS
jgi:hypothetical protein